MSVRLDADSIFSFTFSTASKPLSNTASKAVFEVTSFINTDLALFLISLRTVLSVKLNESELFPSFISLITALDTAPTALSKATSLFAPVPSAAAEIVETVEMIWFATFSETNAKFWSTPAANGLKLVISTPDNPSALATSEFEIEGDDFFISTKSVVAGVTTLEPPGAFNFIPDTFSPVKESVVCESEIETKLAEGSLEFKTKLPSAAVLVLGSPALKSPSLL